MGWRRTHHGTSRDVHSTVKNLHETNIRGGWAANVAVVALVAVVYWPVRHGGFVWDDIINFVENDWLLTGSQWQHYILRDFNGWTNYFRPLGVGLFTIQVRLFGNQPGPMHLVSLGMHLCNTILVGTLAAQMAKRSSTMREGVPVAWPVACMLLYGLHPALIETVAWIGTQYDQFATGFMLAGAIAAVSMQRRIARASVIGLCFFLAVCAKESAVVFPALFLLLDWVAYTHPSRHLGVATLRRRFLRRNTEAIIAILIASVAYLLFRWYGLGHLLQSAPMYGGDLSLLGTVQKIMWTYLSYLKMLAYPWTGLNPIHSFDPGHVEVLRPSLFMASIAFAGLVCWSMLAAYRHASVPAALVLIVTSALLPVLNIVPTGFAVSLYHERYAINALAFGCVVLPLLPWPKPRVLPPPTRRFALWAVAALWVGMSILTIRATVPLWLDDERMWRWAVAGNPASEVAQYNTTAALIRNQKYGTANAYVDEFASTGAACARCDTLIANIELDRGNLQRAEDLVARILEAQATANDLDVRGEYLLAAGRLALAQERYSEASDLLRSGIGLRPGQLAAQVNLATALLNAGLEQEALSAADTALELADESNRPLIKDWRDSIESASDGASLDDQ